MIPMRRARVPAPALLAAVLVYLPAPALADGLSANLAAKGAGDRYAARPIGDEIARRGCDAGAEALFHRFFQRISTIDSKGGGNDRDDTAQRIALFKAFNEMFSTWPLARAALGRYWTEASDSEIQTYFELFHFHFMENYLDLAVQASRHWREHMVTRPLENGEAVVTLEAPGVDNPNLRALEIYVGPAPCGLMLKDVRAAGWSLARLMQAEFQSIARSGGMRALIERLRDRAHASAVWERWQASR